MPRTFKHLVSARFRRLRTAFERISHYDLVLAVIPAVFIVAAVLGQALSLSARLTVAGASVVAAAVVLDALFLNPPGAPE